MRDIQEENCVFELTYNWDQDEAYDKGNAYAQVQLPQLPLSNLHTAVELQLWAASCATLFTPPIDCFLKHQALIFTALLGSSTWWDAIFCVLQVAIGTDDVYKTCDDIKAKGGTITKDAFEVPGIGTKICATTDPDGYKVVFVDNADFAKELQ
jgi:hypothetical protein